MGELLRTWLWRPSSDAKVQFFRSLIVGGLASVLDMLVLAICFESFGWNEHLAVAIGFVFGLTLNFVLTRRWVFTGSRMGLLAELAVFSLIGVLGLALTEGILWVFVGPMAGAALLGDWLSPERYIYPGKVAAIVLVFFWNFLLRKWIVYRK